MLLNWSFWIGLLSSEGYTRPLKTLFDHHHIERVRFSSRSRTVFPRIYSLAMSPICFVVDQRELLFEHVQFRSDLSSLLVKIVNYSQELEIYKANSIIKRYFWKEPTLESLLTE